MAHRSRRPVPAINVLVIALTAVMLPCVYFVLRSTPHVTGAAPDPSPPLVAASAMRSAVSSATESAASPTIAARTSALSVIGLGDSITQGNSKGDTPGLSWFGQLMGLDSHLTFVRNAGVYGQTTAAIRGRVASDVVARHPQVCLIMGGTNDVGQHVPRAVTIANLTAIVDALKVAGIRPVLMSIPPRAQASWAGTISALNAAIHRLADAEHIPYVNVHDVVSTTTGVYKAGDSNDGVHPTVAAHHRMAIAAEAQLAQSAM
jgi:lysophospholipase L1-like esterase